MPAVKRSRECGPEKMREEEKSVVGSLVGDEGRQPLAAGGG